MKKTYIVDCLGKVTLDDNLYLASGGEGSVYVKDNLAYKIYHNKNDMIPVAKIKELEKINSDNVLRPLHVIYENNIPIGYVMKFVENAHPLCKLFTKAFKQRNNVSNEDIINLISIGQDTMNEVHKAGCLVVDFNEMNGLIGKDFDQWYFIDTDSYQVKGFLATAIMESIRDHQIKNNQWTEDSDWFSFAIVSFFMLIGCHPYKGSHPDFSPNDWQLRMEKGASVFDKGASLPAVCNDFSIIPKSYLSWYKEVFGNNKRCPPPQIGSLASIIAIPQSFHVTNVNGIFIVEDIESCPENIIDVLNIMGVNYMICSQSVYKGKAKLPNEIVGSDKVLICESNGANPVICKLNSGTMYAEDIAGRVIGKINANGMMYRNSCIYTVNGGKLIENSFSCFDGTKIIHSTRYAANVLDLSTQVFDGVIFQDFVGKKHITLPYEKGKCIILHIPELDGYRILDARSERNICGIMSEKKGIYYSFVLTFNSGYNAYTTRVTSDVSYSEVNLTVLPNGIAVMINNGEAEIFKGQNVKEINNPPFNATTKLFNYSGQVCYLDGKTIKSAKMKK